MSISFNNYPNSVKQECHPILVPAWILFSQPIINFFSNHVITPTPFPMDDVFVGSKEM
jgi:hypothetical protein